MSVSPRRTAWRGCSLSVVGALLVLGVVALAQVRPYSDYSPFDPSPNNATYRTFSPGGLAGIAGGVLFQGNAKFLREHGTSELVDTGSLVLSMGTPPAVTITFEATRYNYKLHAGMACPLGKFVNRGGEIVFTIPEDNSADAYARLKAAGVGRLATYSNPVFGANEFIGTPFIPLLDKVDFADVVQLPPDLERAIADNINRTSGTGPVEGRGVYVNSDAQTTYSIYLVDDQPGRGHVEISGVPLKYSWVQRRDGSFGVFKVEAFSQQWSGPQSLTAFQGNSEPTQYDVVSFYQAAGMFRALQRANPTAFATFVDSACGVHKVPASSRSSKNPSVRPKVGTDAKKAAPPRN
jgi:hypothetical protein